MTGGRAREWVSAATVRWPRMALVAAGVGALVASAVGDDRPCSVADPTVCGPDPVFSAAVVAALAAIVLVWWLPVLAAACAVGFAAIDLALDPVTTANVAWPALAAMHLGHLALLHRARRREREVAAAATEPVPESVRAAVVRAGPPPPAPLGPVHAAVVVLLLVALASGGMLSRETSSDAAHLARAVGVSARVAGYDEGSGETRFVVDRPEPGIPAEVRLETIGTYEPGDVVELTVDRADPGWTHLSAEPPDPTWWLSIALAALLLAAVLGRRLLVGRVHRAVLAASPPDRGVAVRWLEGDDVVGVLATDEDLVLAELDVLARPRDVLLVPTLETATRPGWLVGDVRPGGWASLVHAHGVEPAVAPLRALPDLPLADDSSVDPDLEDDPLAGTEPVPETARAAALPAVARPPAWRRVLGLVGALGVPAAVWWLLPEVMGEGASVIGLGLGAASIVVSGLGWALSSSVAGPDAVTLSGGLVRHTIPLSAVTAVRVGAREVVLLLEDGDHVALGPWREEEPRAAAVDPARHRPPTAAQVAAALDDRRVVARAAAPEAAEVRHRPGVGALLLVLAVATVAARALTLLVG